MHLYPNQSNAAFDARRRDAANARAGKSEGETQAEAEAQEAQEAADEAAVRASTILPPPPTLVRQTAGTGTSNSHSTKTV